MWTILLLKLAANPPVTSLSPVETKEVKIFIDSLAKRRTQDGNGADEFVGGRRVVRGDVDGDGKADLVVLFTLEQGNVWTQFLGLFGVANKVLASGRVGGKGQRSVELRQVIDGRVEASPPGTTDRQTLFAVRRSSAGRGSCSVPAPWRRRNRSITGGATK